MDPYLERHWGDVHTRLVTYARDQLQKFLPRDLRARVEERVIVSQWDRPRSLHPDVRVIETERISRRPAKSGASVAVAQPLVIELADEAETQTDDQGALAADRFRCATGFAGFARSMLRKRRLRRYRLQRTAGAATTGGRGALGRTTPSPGGSSPRTAT